MSAPRTLAAVTSAAVGAALALAGCTATEEPTSPATTESSTTEGTATTTEAATQTERSVSLPASGELDGRRVTVESFGSTTLVFAEPEPGNEAVYIEVTVENVSAEPWRSNTFQFFLVDQDGTEWAPELLGSEAGDTLPDVDGLDVGESSTGFVAFQVPEGSQLTLSYAVDLSVGATIEIPVR